MSTLLLALIIFLFALSAFWSGSETALTSLSVTRVKKLIALNPRIALALKYWLEKPHYILTIILVGNTFTNMFLSSLSAVLALSALDWALPRAAIDIIAWLGVTFLLLVLGEITPKVYCRRNPERVSVMVLPFYESLIKILRPFLIPVEFAFKKLLPGDKISPFGRMAHFSSDEMSQLFSESNLDAMFGDGTLSAVDKVLNIGTMDVSRVMTPVEKIEGVCLDCRDEGLLDKFIETSRSRIPVVRRSPYRVAGYVHIKDILNNLAAGGETFDEDIVRMPYIIPGDKKVGRLLREFQSGNTHVAFVADSDGAILGLVTLEDILEEIVGEILDEYDAARDLSAGNSKSAASALNTNRGEPVGPRPEN
ncbi:MAG: hemolysin family protein [Endomicrobiia bacterium]|nr:hemolysin family protein [Endomicrobiia bacterium]